MENRRYFSIRTGKHDSKNQYDISMLRKLFKATYDILYKEDYFNEAIGFYCVDEGFIHGFVGSDFELYLLKKLRKENLWPIDSCYLNYSEDDIFDLIELFYDIISMPLDGSYHNWNNCGMHYNTFDKEAGQERFRKEINEFLVDYGDGWELSEKGEILLVGDDGLNHIFKAEIPNVDEDNITIKIKLAVSKFRRQKSTLGKRRMAYQCRI